MGVKIVPKEIKAKPKEGEVERTRNTLALPEQGYGIMTSSSAITSPSKPNPAPKGTRYNPMTDQSIAPMQYEKPKSLGPTGIYHSGPYNKSVGNGRNGVTAMQGGKIMKKLQGNGGKETIVQIGETSDALKTKKDGTKYALSMFDMESGINKGDTLVPGPNIPTVFSKDKKEEYIMGGNYKAEKISQGNYKLK